MAGNKHKTRLERVDTNRKQAPIGDQKSRNLLKKAPSQKSPFTTSHASKSKTMTFNGLIEPKTNINLRPVTREKKPFVY